MFKKSDILPLILAFISTLMIVGLSFLWLAKSNIVNSGTAGNINQDGFLDASDVKSDQPESSVALSANSDSSEQVFVTPYIVPQGTAVTINGSRNMTHVNQLLRKRFHKKFPGTAINIKSDGNDVGINLLVSGEIDIAAIDRPLEQAEQDAGLAMIKIDHSSTDNVEQLSQKASVTNGAIRLREVKSTDSSPQGKASSDQELYYAYREPANSEVEAFLGYVLSPEAQLAINRNLSAATN